MTFEIILTKKDGVTPFVTKKGNQFFIESVKYTDDVLLLFTAIKKVKETPYSDLDSKKIKKSKETYWLAHFNYQWSGGGLIQWQNPNELWECELARTHKLKCKKCNGIMFMFNVPYCPICKGLQKIKGESYYNYTEMVNLVESKYDFEVQAFHNFKFKKVVGKKGSSLYNILHQNKWELKHFPDMKKYCKNPLPNYKFNAEALAFFNTYDGNKFWNEVHITYRKALDGECMEIPYMNFWHFMIDEYFCEVSNGCLKTINWKDVMCTAKKDWQKEICGYFVKEYGDKNYKVSIDW